MKGNRSLFIAVGVVAVLILGLVVLLAGRRFGRGSTDRPVRRGREEDRMPGSSLSRTSPSTARPRRPSRSTPSVGTRLTFKTHIPDDGWLRVSVALKPEAWTQEGDGVRFMALVSDGRASDELFIQDVNPFANQTDRKWIPVMVDLSAYAGEDVDIILNTYASAPGKGVDMRNDLAVWGAPEIVVR